MYAEHNIQSWEEFLDLISDSPYNNWAFRGQRDASWELSTALSRYFLNYRINPKAWPEQEGRILRIFKRKAHQFLDHPPQHDDDFQWLALMQHHGAPTRMLDFTWSPYVAAFFALERAICDCAIWALNPAEVKYVQSQVVKTGQAITPGELDPKDGDNFRKYFLEGDIPFVWLGEPLIMNTRLIAQSGTFAIPGVLHQPIEEILSGYPHPERTMAKFILATDRLREKGMKELYRMNITHATLFPDLDGLARSLAYELEFHWSYDPRTLKRYLPQ